MLPNHAMRLPEILYLLITHSAMCSAIHSSAVDTGTVIGLISPTLMKVVSDNKADSKRAFTLSPHLTSSANQIPKYFNNKHQSFQFIYCILRSNSESGFIFFFCTVHGVNPTNFDVFPLEAETSILV